MVPRDVQSVIFSCFWGLNYRTHAYIQHIKSTHTHTYKQYTCAHTTQTTHTYTLQSWAQGVRETAGHGAGGLETLRRMWSRAVARLQLERTTPQPPNNPHIIRITVIGPIKIHAR